MNVIISFIVLSLAYVCCANTPPPNPWVQIQNDPSLQVYMQKQTPTMPLGVKAVSQVQIPFEVLATALLDVASYPDWMEELKEASIVEQASPDDFLLYNYYDFPWPFADRDIYVRVRIVRKMKQGLVLAYIDKEENPNYPPIPGVVRIPIMKGILQIRYIDKSHTEGSFTEWFDMGGNVPEWLKDIFAKQVPSSVLHLVKQACQKPKYWQKAQSSTIRAQLDSALSQGYLKPNSPVQ
jgi:hypothetical protein